MSTTIMTLQEYNEATKAFITYLRVERNVSEHTVRAYQSDLKQFGQFWLLINNQEPIAITMRRALERFFVSLYHKKIDKSSIARKISCFHSLEKFLQGQDKVIDLHLQRPRLDKKLPVYLSMEELAHLLDAVPTTDLKTQRPLRDRAILELLYATGIRCSELIAIRLGDIDFQDRAIRITGKGRKERMVLFGSKAQDKINDYLGQERTPVRSMEEYLFLNCRKTGLTTRSVQRIVKKFCSFLKSNRPITPHKIRHSFATHMLKQGADLRVIQELLGHKSLTSTEVYTHVTPQQLLKMCNELHPVNTTLKGKKTSS